MIICLCKCGVIIIIMYFLWRTGVSGLLLNQHTISDYIKIILLTQHLLYQERIPEYRFNIVIMGWHLCQPKLVFLAKMSP